MFFKKEHTPCYPAVRQPAEASPLSRGDIIDLINDQKVLPTGRRIAVSFTHIPRPVGGGNLCPLSRGDGSLPAENPGCVRGSRLLPEKTWISITILLFILSGLFTTARSQTIPVGDLREEQLRIQQLLRGSELSSFANRPVWDQVYTAYMDMAIGQPGWWNRNLGTREFQLGEFDSRAEGFTLGVYEPVFQTTTNSRLPFGENNAAAWYGKGFNTELLGGFYITSDYVTVTFRPQIVYSQNNDFITPRFIPTTETSPGDLDSGDGGFYLPPRYIDGDSDEEIRYVAEAIFNRIDRPFRFGPDPIWTFDSGHTSLRFHYNAIEAGLSSEPLWWGGSILYPLMMSNNAPGMKHLFLGTRRPLRVPWVGSFEFRWMGGWPKDSRYFDLDEDYQRKRFMNAINVIYSPEFVPNFSIGLTRAYHFYIEEDGLDWNDIFVIFDPFQKKRLVEKRGIDQERKQRNQLASIHARWVWPEQNMEIFGEFFREDHSWDWRDFMMQPLHNSGYAFGFQNLIHLPDLPYLDKIDFLKFHFEFTQLTPSRQDELRNQTYYYTHNEIRQGHTNKGQVLGAAIGPGSNSVYFGLDAYSGNTTAGLSVQRWADNDHFHYEYNQPRGPRFFGDKWRHPVNLDIGARFMYGPGPWYFSGKFTWTQAFNYGRFNYGIYDGIDWDTREKDDMFNIQMQVSVRYVF